MSVEFIPQDTKAGVAAFALVYDARATQIEIMTLADDEGGEIVSCDDNQDYDTHRFKAGAGFVVVQFGPGMWQCEASNDGTRFRKQGEPWRSAEGSLFELTLCIDGENLNPQRWYRWTKVA